MKELNVVEVPQAPVIVSDIPGMGEGFLEHLLMMVARRQKIERDSAFEQLLSAAIFAKLLEAAASIATKQRTAVVVVREHGDFARMSRTAMHFFRAVRELSVRVLHPLLSH